jgi:hypothetical protein
MTAASLFPNLITGLVGFGVLDFLSNSRYAGRTAMPTPLA